ncbi:response regulator transcription factor [Actinophytocola sp.]|uniref:response regulator transcription factor n=1 Tax=Actinophytocola sp. TaxID=1872138 RepID=UPI0025B9D4B2|nr:response regulator transcription factor [Actinophytocola sp.]
MTANIELGPARETVRVVIADDHPVYLSGLRMLLDLIGEVEVVGEARTGTEALSEIYRLRPHLALMDVNMPGTSGIEVTKTIATRCPGTSVIMLSMLEDRDTFLAAMRAGARGYLVKGASSEDIGQAIGTVRRGGVVFGSEVASWALDYLNKPRESSKPFPELTDRERAVLELVADGLGNASIARRLGLSIKTVRNYLSRIFAKLQIADRTEAAVQARRAGLGN